MFIGLACKIVTDEFGRAVLHLKINLPHVVRIVSIHSFLLSAKPSQKTCHRRYETGTTLHNHKNQIVAIQDDHRGPRHYTYLRILPSKDRARDDRGATLNHQSPNTNQLTRTKRRGENVSAVTRIGPRTALVVRSPPARSIRSRAGGWILSTN